MARLAGRRAIQQRDLVASTHFAVAALDENLGVPTYRFEHALRCRVQQLVQSLCRVDWLLAALAFLAVLAFR